MDLLAKGCLADESIRCGQHWTVTVTYGANGLYGVLDRFVTMSGGYPLFCRTIINQLLSMCLKYLKK